MGGKPFFGQKRIGERLFFYGESLLTGRKLAIFVQNLIPLAVVDGQRWGTLPGSAEQGGRAA